jgi:hypothetical protein
VSGSTSVVGIILLEWAVGLVAVAGWVQSWKVVRRGHFRIVAWCAFPLAIGGVFALNAAIPSSGFDKDLTKLLTAVAAGAVGFYLVAQYVRSDLVGAIVGYIAGALGAVALFEAGSLIDGWSQGRAAVGMVVGAALLGAVTNGMLLGHWYLNQPGLKPWALARLTTLGLVVCGLAGIAGLASVGTLTGGDVSVIGMAGFGGSASPLLFGAWIAIVVFTAVVVYMARRCVRIRSIQSATGLYYVALLTGGVSEFLVRYLMMNA